MREKLVAKYRYSLILLKELVKTDFKLRYQGSVLGYLWSLLKPLFLFIILYFVFVHFLRIQGGSHWPVAMLFGIVLWNFFSEVTNQGLSSIVGRGDVLRKINFPKYIIVLSSSVSALINLGLNMIVLFVFMWADGMVLHWSMLIAPLFVLELFIFAVGLAFILSTVYVKLRDMNMIWEVIMQALFYGSAVIYPLSMVYDMNTTIGKLFLLNPITQSIQEARAALIDPSNMSVISSGFDPIYLTVPVIVVITTFVFGAWLFKKNSPSFAEKI
jgi:ABC-2 type transport system permease protein